MKNLSFLSLLVMLFVYSCSAPLPPVVQLDMEKVRAEISELEAAYTAASNAKDIDALMAYYADDAQSFGPDEPALVGKNEIRASALEQMEEDSGEGSTATMGVTDVWAAGNIAVETGTWTVTDTEGNVTKTGKYMSLFEKRDGKYICIRDIWNSDEGDDDDDDDEDEGETEN